MFPNDVVRRFNNIHKNAVYILLSNWVINLWTIEYNYKTLPVIDYAFPVDTIKFTPTDQPKEKVFVYFKRRNPAELEFVCQFLRSKNIDFITFDYGSYNEIEYINILNQARYGIWIGTHESQGFAVEEALFMNVPLLVWNARYMKQEHGSSYDKIKTYCTTTPYWDDRCGIHFYTKEELNESYDNFINKLSKFNPRQYILENLSLEHRANALKKMIDEIN